CQTLFLVSHSARKNQKQSLTPRSENRHRGAKTKSDTAEALRRHRGGHRDRPSRLARVLVPAFPEVEASQVHPCVVSSPDSPPGLKSLARQLDEGESLLLAERAGQVVICLVAGLLESDEGVRHTLQVDRGCVASPRGLHRLRELVVRDHRGGLLHLPVVVRPVDPCGHPGLRGVEGRCLPREQMEQRVVGRRDGTTKIACLGHRGSSWASCSAWSRRSAWRLMTPPRTRPVP